MKTTSSLVFQDNKVSWQCSVSCSLAWLIVSDIQVGRLRLPVMTTLSVWCTVTFRFKYKVNSEANTSLFCWVQYNRDVVAPSGRKGLITTYHTHGLICPVVTCHVVWFNVISIQYVQYPSFPILNHPSIFFVVGQIVLFPRISCSKTC